MPYCSNCGAAEMSGQKFCPTCGSMTAHEPGTATPLPYFPMDPPAPTRIANLANFWWRALSFVIDSIILAVASDVPLRAATTGHDLSSIIESVVVFAYFTLFIAFANGQTPGMMVVRIRCVTLDDRGSVGLAQAARRSLANGALVLIGDFYSYTRYRYPTPAQAREQANQALVLFSLYVPHYLDLLWAAWDPKRQTLHDKFARTVVLRDEKVAQPAPGALDMW